MVFVGALPADASVRASSDEKKDSSSSSDNYALITGKDAESVSGIMTVHKVKNTYYLEIPFGVMSKPMLLATKVSSTSDNSTLIAGQMTSEPLLVEWGADKDNVYLLDASVKASCDPAESIAKGVALNHIKPIMKSFPIKATNPDSTAVVIDVTKFFCCDEKHMSLFSSAGTLGRSTSKKAVFRPELSSVIGADAFVKNVNFRTRMSYTVGTSPFTATVCVSMVSLPERPMRPRLSDHRLGYFKDIHISYSEKKNRSEVVSYINRWNLAPKPEDVERYKAGELVEPAKPIVYYLDDAFPKEWRPYLKEGVEDWQKAFEAIGFKNAIVAKDYPTDDPEFNPEDVRYSCIRYASTRVANAMGPSWTDPRSGEIIQGSVYFYHDVLKLLHNWYFIQTSAVNPPARKEVYDMETMGPLLRYLIVHEVGHTLGIMHNMRASYAYPVDSLRSKTFTDKYGTTASVMDYARYNYIAQPGDGVTWLLPPRLGPYDYHIIKWGYKPIFEAETPQDEKPVLNAWIREKEGDPMYSFGRQEVLSYTDPAAQAESLGDDAVKAGKYGIANLKIIMENLIDWTSREGEPYDYTYEMYNEIMTQFNRYMGHAIKYIGGNYLNYPVHGDGKNAFTPVSRAKQKEALEFVISSASEMSEWMENKEILHKFGPASPPVPNQQAAYIRTLTSLYSRVASTSASSDDPYTLMEYQEDLLKYIFTKPLRKGRLTPSERHLQYVFVYSIFEDLGMLKPAASGSSFAEGLFGDNQLGDDVLLGEDQQSLSVARKESDTRVQAKAVSFNTLQKIKYALSRAYSRDALDRVHFEYLLFEINRELALQQRGE